jgi:hypothetical protein
MAHYLVPFIVVLIYLFRSRFMSFTPKGYADLCMYMLFYSRMYEISKPALTTDHGMASSLRLWKERRPRFLSTTLFGTFAFARIADR